MQEYVVALKASRKRRIFEIDGVEERVVEIAKQLAPLFQAAYLRHEVVQDFGICFFITVINDPEGYARHLASLSSSLIRQEFPELSKMPSLWVRDFYLSGTYKKETVDLYFLQTTR